MFGRYQQHVRPVETAAFHDKAWKRADQAVWDERWARLSVPARQLYLSKVKAAASPQTSKPLNVTASFPGAVVEEWRKAGLIRDENASDKPGFIVVDDAIGFTARLRALERYHLLAESPGEFEKYIQYAFTLYGLMEAIDKIVEKQTGLHRYALGVDPMQMFVKRRRWPEWVTAYLNDPLARPVVAAVEAAGGSLPLSRLAEQLAKKNPSEVRRTVDRLVNHLALVEDLDAKSFDIVVGLLPAVRTDRESASQKTTEKPLPPARAVEAGRKAGRGCRTCGRCCWKWPASRPG